MTNKKLMKFLVEMLDTTIKHYTNNDIKTLGKKETTEVVRHCMCLALGVQSRQNFDIPKESELVDKYKALLAKFFYVDKMTDEIKRELVRTCCDGCTIYLKEVPLYA